jgi:hypothetical protein
VERELVLKPSQFALSRPGSYRVIVGMTHHNRILVGKRKGLATTYISNFSALIMVGQEEEVYLVAHIEVTNNSNV